MLRAWFVCMIRVKHDRGCVLYENESVCSLSTAKSDKKLIFRACQEPTSVVHWLMKRATKSRKKTFQKHTKQVTKTTQRTGKGRCRGGDPHNHSCRMESEKSRTIVLLRFFCLPSPYLKYVFGSLRVGVEFQCQCEQCGGCSRCPTRPDLKGARN